MAHTQILEKSGETHLPTKLIAETFPHMLPKLPDTLQYIYDVNWFPENFVNITELPSETIQRLTIQIIILTIKYTNKKL